MNMLNEYVFIVDPYSSGALYANEIIKLGLTPVAILSCYPIYDIYVNSFNHNDFKHIFVFKDSIDNLIEELTSLLGKNKPAFVLAGAESGVELADKLAHHFRPDYANILHLSTCRRNKFDMSQQLLKSYVPAPLAIKSNSIDEVINWSKDNNLFPLGVVIKPINSVGTDSVTACFNENDIKDAMKRYIGTKNLFNLNNDCMLAQEFLNGTEYVVDTVSFAGKHRITNVCRYKKIQTNGARFVYDSLEFLDPNDDLVLELGEYIYSVLNALGIQYGPAHSEVIYTVKGPRLVETGARTHGGIGISACRMATGTSHLDATLALFSDKDKIVNNEIKYEIKNNTKIVFLISHMNNIIKAEDINMKKLKKLSSLKFLKLNVKVGDVLQKTTDFFNMPGLLILSDESEKQVMDDYHLIRRLEKEGLFIF